ncbi:MAG TPA: c-type cytochrome [Leeuwenhoekiella sp.]|nr:c-type cytochrome [Leeuwenhoekiella sp.]
MRINIGLLAIYAVVTACQSSYKEPKITLEGYKIEEGFDLDLVASEPFLDAPVAMDFDSQGRLWVAEMPGFMENLEGRGQKEPTGSIKILEDLDNDGIIDHTNTFLDSLIMPRALKLVYGGLLYVEPPNLYFVEIEDDRPGNRIVVDSSYAPQGNPEYQPNGLVLNIDNWIYSAKSNFRYRRKNGKWLKQPTTNRGQWGISHDNFGRLYYNHNSQQLLGDYVLPNRLIRNKFFVPKYGLNRLLTDDQRVYPLHPTAVNRGYAKGILDKDSLLINVTAACGPLIYQGGNFPEGYEENAFVCVPEANLIKRNILSFHGDSTSAKQAWQGKEFLASTDEGFRPVNLVNGPDGAIYIADMHRGVIQHYAFLSPYLKKKAKKEQLDTLIGFGRILKIQNKDSEHAKIPDFEKTSVSELVQLLGNKNGWIRDRAQRYLILKDKSEAVPALEELVGNNTNPIAQVHALYALEGLNALSFSLLNAVVKESDAEVVSHTITLMEEFVSKENAPLAMSVFQELMEKQNVSIDMYLATTVGTWAKAAPDIFAPLMYTLYKRYKNNTLITEALVSGSGKTTKELIPYLQKFSDFENSELSIKLIKNIDRQKGNKLNAIYADNEHKMDNRTRGAQIFRQICAACHGLDGKGIEGIAPPFYKSEYLSGPAERVGLIVLHGLKGPLYINGKLYDLDQAMPGMAGNESLSNEDISDVISYVTNAFSRNSKYLAPEKIKKLRERKPEDGREFTEQELMSYVKKLQ